MLDAFVQGQTKVRDDLFQSVTGCFVPEVDMTFEVPILQVREGKVGYLSTLVTSTIKVTGLSEPYTKGYGTSKCHYLDVSFEVLGTSEDMQKVFVIDPNEIESYFEEVEGIEELEVGMHQLLVVGAPEPKYQAVYLTEKECEVSDYGFIYIY